MKKKAKKSVLKRHIGPTLFDTLPKNHGEWLELCIKFTMRVVKNPPDSELDKTMLAQADRLRKQLELWRKNETSGKKTES